MELVMIWWIIGAVVYAIAIISAWESFKVWFFGRW
jgi:hypothetical protein